MGSGKITEYIKERLNDLKESELSPAELTAVEGAVLSIFLHAFEVEQRPYLMEMWQQGFNAASTNIAETMALSSFEGTIH